MNKQEFIWLTKRIDLLKECIDSGLSEEFVELSTRLYWKLRNKRDRLLEQSSHGIVS